MEIAVPATPEVSIIVPARNEEVCLGDCLLSLVSQTGVTFEIIVVDDHSTDRTRQIAESFVGVRVISSDPLPEGWTGKNNAVVTGAREARGEWLLFTDADTVHLPGSLARARGGSEGKFGGVAVVFAGADCGYVLGTRNLASCLRRIGAAVPSGKSK